MLIGMGRQMCTALNLSLRTDNLMFEVNVKGRLAISSIEGCVGQLALVFRETT